jgi:alpha-beta hydrolase superfamily lysophospholipase
VAAVTSRRLAAVVAVALVVVACADDDAGEEAGAATTAPTTPATSGAPAATTTMAGTTTMAPAPTTTEPTPSTSGDAGTAPEGDAFYVAPDPLPDGQPGDVIWSRPLTDPPAGAEGRLILYRSTAADGSPVAVSGVAIWPAGAPPAATGRPVVSIAHGTTGIADECAPTRQLMAGGASEITLWAAAIVPRDWVLVATDYQGLGTPGLHPYLVGQAAGRNVLDAVRAAAQLGVTGVTAASPVVILGHSQGGGSSAFAAELAPSYAPELDVRGAVAGAPATELASLQGVPLPPQALGYGMMVAAGFHAAYPALPLDTVLTPAGEAALPETEDGCAGEVLDRFESETAATVLTPAGAPGSDQWASALEENTAGRVATDVPVYVFHGDADTTVPPGWSEAYQARACATGTDVARTVYPGADHSSVLLEALPAASEWLDARVAGEPAPSGCP